jgi:hypothetical protein
MGGHASNSTPGITGTLPSALSQLTSMKAFSIWNMGMLNVSVPATPDWGPWPALQTLSLGDLPTASLQLAPLLTWLRGSQDLTTLQIRSAAGMNGTSIMTSQFRLLPATFPELQTLWLAKQGLTGVLPLEWSTTRGRFIDVRLQENALYGNVPNTWWQAFQNDSTVDVSSNQLMGGYHILLLACCVSLLQCSLYNTSGILRHGDTFTLSSTGIDLCTTERHLVAHIITCVWCFVVLLLTHLTCGQYRYAARSLGECHDSLLPA